MPEDIVQKWEEAKEFTKTIKKKLQSKIEFGDLESLISESESFSVQTPEMQSLMEHLTKAKEWAAKIEFSSDDVLTLK